MIVQRYLGFPTSPLTISLLFCIVYVFYFFFLSYFSSITLDRSGEKVRAMPKVKGRQEEGCGSSRKGRKGPAEAGERRRWNMQAWGLGMGTEKRWRLGHWLTGNITTRWDERPQQEDNLRRTEPQEQHLSGAWSLFVSHLFSSFEIWHSKM